MKAKPGDTVKIHYVGSLEDGQQFDSTLGNEAFQFRLGSDQVIQGLNEGVVGMSVGEKKTLRIPPEKAYGRYFSGRVAEFDRAQINTDVPIKEGVKFTARTKSGKPLPVIVTKVNENTITIDGNHELAGKTLIFELELIQII